MMKRVAVLMLVWYMFTNASEPSSEWITYLTEDDGTVHKCKREDYQEMMEFMESNAKEREFKDYINWEFKEKFKIRKRMSKITQYDE